MADKVDCIVIGAGVVGLAAARALAMRGRETLVLEAERAVGAGTSSRNSEVIHAGIHYPPGSAKARLCVRGKGLLYRYCSEKGVPFRRCGKLIVAADAQQLGALSHIESSARASGVADLQRLDARAARTREPALACVAALLSPSTGILDSHALMLALQGDIERAGGAIALRTKVRAGRCGPRSIQLVTEDEGHELEADVVVNSAGLEAQAVARAIDGVRPQSVPPSFFAKGSYFVLAGRAPFQHLVYPVPVPGGLGVHLTLDLAGRARFGPDVEWVDRPEYQVDPARARDFYAAIRRYWPALPEDSLGPGYAGIRPKLSGPGAPAADFAIQGPEAHGARGLVNLFGIESPGLTAALAIGEHVADVVGSWS